MAEKPAKQEDLRVKPDYDPRSIREYMNAEQIATLEQFRASLGEIYPTKLTKRQEIFLTDSTLCRYLRARDWKLKKAQQMLVNSLKWQREYKPWRIVPDDVLGEMKNEGKLYHNGFDKYGRPVIYMKPRLDTTGPKERVAKVEYIVLSLDLLTRLAETKGREKVTLVVDFKSFSQLTGMSQIKISQEFMKILSDHMPERLGNALIVNAPWIWGVFWKIISPIIDDVTKQKVKILKHTTDLLQYFTEDQLEKDYGGKNEFKYDFETYKKYLDELYTQFHDRPAKSSRAHPESTSDATDTSKEEHNKEHKSKDKHKDKKDKKEKKDKAEHHHEDEAKSDKDHSISHHEHSKEEHSKEHHSHASKEHHSKEEHSHSHKEHHEHHSKEEDHHSKEEHKTKEHKEKHKDKKEKKDKKHRDAATKETAEEVPESK
eukprot:TRINITY_DN282_c0_g1_i1.p1 TRINITY_DN282_c0_g1~~TRINITY_DN282_c0_g1_i1.p1  ORF type:complete len:429 (+),score=89.25 TRINITY_DN282_c0_g1_i1:567-1853(+)